MEKATDEVLWIKLLPEQLKGGPMSKTQIQRRQREANARLAPSQRTPLMSASASAPMASGGSVHTEKFKRLAEKLKAQGKGKSAFPIAMSALGYEGSVKKEHRRKPGYAMGESVMEDLENPGGYTGDDGEKVLADKVANTKEFDDHEGEYYVNAPMTSLLGGPDEVEKLILERAQRNIDSAASGQPQVRPGKPIMAESDKDKTMNPKSDIRSSFYVGGLTTPIKDLSKTSGASDLTGNTQAGLDGGSTPAAIGSGITSLFPSLPGTHSTTPTLQFQGAAPAPKPMDVKPLPTDTGSFANKDMIAEGTTKSDNSGNTYTYKNGAWQQTSAVSDAELNKSSNVPIPEGTVKSAGGSSYTYKNGKWELTTSVPESELYKNKPAPVAPTTPAPLAGQRDINYGLAYLRDIANGKNPVLAGMINQALQKHGANTAAGKAELQMRLGQEGITGEAADAAMESYDRNARIGRSQVETSLTQQGMEQAQTAAGQLLTAGQSERANAKSNLETIMANDLAAGNFEQYAAHYEQAYGVKPDTNVMQKAFKDKQFNDAREGLAQEFTTNPAATINDSRVSSLLQTMWENEGHAGSAPDSYKTEQWANIQHANDTVWQYSHSMNDESVLNNWFNGDKGELDNFSYEGKTGMSAFREAFLPDLVRTGGVTMVKDPDTGLQTFKIDPDNSAIKSYFSMSTVGKVDTTITPNKTYTIGQKLEDGTKVQDVKDGRVTSVTDGTTLWNITYTSDGKVVRTQNKDGLKGESGQSITYNGMPLKDDKGNTITREGDKYYATRDGEKTEMKVDSETGKVTPAIPIPATPGEAMTSWQGQPSSYYSNYKKAVGSLSLDNDEDALKYFANLGNSDAQKDLTSLAVEDLSGSAKEYFDAEDYKSKIETAHSDKVKMDEQKRNMWGQWYHVHTTEQRAAADKRYNDLVNGKEGAIEDALNRAVSDYPQSIRESLKKELRTKWGL